MGLLLGLLLSTPLIGEAQAGDPGTVLRIDGVELYVDLSASDGLAPGDPVYLYRQVRVRTVDGRVLSDPFLLGRGVAVEVGDELSLIRGEPGVMLQLAVGDVVAIRALVPPEPVRPVLLEPVVVQQAAPAECPDPVVVQAEPEPMPAAGPEQAPEAGWTAVELTPEPEPVIAAVPIQFVSIGPAEILVGEPLRVLATVPEAGRVQAARLFFRREGEPGYRHVDMQRAGDASWSGTVPQEAAQDLVEWYVALEDADGAESQGNIHSQNPSRTLVSEDVPLSRPRAGRTELAVRYYWVDFYQLDGSDRMSRVEADVLYRLDRPLHAVRLGFGRWAGVSRPMRSFDDPSTSVSAGFQYGFLELEAPQGVDWVWVAARGMAGVHEGGLEGGIEGRLRIGPEEGTSLQGSAARIGPLGEQYGLGLAWNTVPRVPMRADVLVTNLPAARAEDFGVHLVWEGRTRVTKFAELGLRLGYPLRAVHHSGLSAGGSLVMSW